MMRAPLTPPFEVCGSIEAHGAVTVVDALGVEVITLNDPQRAREVAADLNASHAPQSEPYLISILELGVGMAIGVALVGILWLCVML